MRLIRAAILSIALTALLAVSASAALARTAAPPAPLPPATIKARQHLLGKKNVNPVTGAVRKDRVILSWFGVANFIASFKGHVVLLDDFLRRGYDLRQIHTTIDELAALKPEYIFLGHGHFDHALDAGQVSAMSGAKIVGTPQHCAQVKQWASMMRGYDPKLIHCITVMDQHVPLGTTVHMNRLMKNVRITVVRHVHFPYSPADPTGLGETSLNNGKQGPEWPCPQEPQWEGFAKFPGDSETAKNLFFNIVAAGQAQVPNSDGGLLLYQFHVGRIYLTWHDTQGTLDYYPQVVNALKALPPSDIELGSIASYQRFTDCLHDVRLYWEALRTRIFVPMHDDPSDPSEPNAAYYKPFIADELARTPAPLRPCTDMIEDPQDYLRPDLLTFSIRKKPSCNPALRLEPQDPQTPPISPPGGGS